jgi:hypothetical protein
MSQKPVHLRLLECTDAPVTTLDEAAFRAGAALDARVWAYVPFTCRLPVVRPVGAPLALWLAEAVLAVRLKASASLP